MDYLSETLNKDIDSHLTAEERATARGLRALIEDHFYFCLVLDRWVYKKAAIVKDVFAPLPVPGFLAGMALSRISGQQKKACHAQGMGRHSREEVEAMGLKDLKTISQFLGEEKTFMMGEQVRSWPDRPQECQK